MMKLGERVKPKVIPLEGRKFLAKVVDGMK